MARPIMEIGRNLERRLEERKLLARVVYQLTTANPVRGPECVLCGAVHGGFAVEAWSLEMHEPDCPWALAVRLVAESTAEPPAAHQGQLPPAKEVLEP